MQANAHILIVDDVVDNIQVAMSILKEDNYSLSFATDGEEALALISNNPDDFDLILLDVMMPKLDGFALCKALKQSITTSHIPIIFVTAKTDIDAINKGFELGAVDYITKPYHGDELLARVKNHIELYRAKRLLQQHNLDLEAKVQFSRKRMLSELEHTQRELIQLLTELMESTSDETGKHIKRVSDICATLARFHPALSAEDEEVLRHASPMHDIGKMTVPHDILHKPARYTDDEFDMMKAHTTNAYNLLKNSQRRLFRSAAIIAHEHHEKWNGTGYPRGLKGDEIHIYGRIVALADVFDALTHKRCYKEAWGMEDALNYIKQERGKHFDPELVDIFIDHFDEFRKICQS